MQRLSNPDALEELHVWQLLTQPTMQMIVPLADLMVKSVKVILYISTCPHFIY